MKQILAGLAVATMIGSGVLPAVADDMNADPGSKSPAAYPADNSGKNARDASGATVTPEDQSNSKQDLEITRNIRRAVTEDDSLSMNAKNIKIVTSGGVGTLRGPVQSEQEKTSIATKAKNVAGVSRVDNQLETESR